MLTTRSLSVVRRWDGTGHTDADNLDTDEDEREDDIENTQRGQLVRTVPRDETVVGVRG